jgi:hypothetical protein
MQLAPCPTLKTDIKFLSALNKKIITNACLWRLIRRLCEVFFPFWRFFFQLATLKNKSNSTHAIDFCEKQGSKVATFGIIIIIS